MCVLYKPKHLRHHTGTDEQVCQSPYILSGTIARILKECSEMVGQIFCVFSLEANFLPPPQCSKPEKFQKVILKDLSLWKQPLSLHPPPQAVTGLSKTLCTQILQCNSSGQQRKPEISTLRQCPAAGVFCLTKHCRKLFFNSQLHHLRKT